ncbi:DinB family protein, partial [Staphylococcus sp. SIMBA_130]
MLAYDSDVLFHPTTEGKWSVAEIIAHLAFWDKYIAEETIPKMKPNARIESVEFQVLNDQASEYALSGVSFNTLIEELI